MYGEDYSTWEKMGITQEIFDALMAETIPLENIKFTYNGVTESPKSYIAQPELANISFNKNSFTSAFRLFSDLMGINFYIKSDGTTTLTSNTWD